MVFLVVLQLSSHISPSRILPQLYAYYRSLDESVYIRASWNDTDLELDNDDDEGEELDSSCDVTR
jgi:hypothetical protein